MTSSMVNRWVRPEIQALTAYAVPDSSGMVKLDAMENPYSWPEELLDGWWHHLKGVSLNRYPDPQASSLKDLLAQNMGVPAGQQLLLGNGSDEIIQMIALTVAAPGRVILAPEPGFAMYRLISSAVGMQYCGVELNPADFSLNMPAMRAAIEKYAPAVIFLAYPNNPTGNLWHREEVDEIISIAPGLVVVDEAYAPFASDSFMAACGNYDKMLVMRTVSKMGLAGLRLGLLVGSDVWLSQINKLRLPYNINILTQSSAEFALQHAELFTEQALLIRQDRELMFAALEQMAGIHVWPSEANFILFRVPEGKARTIFEALKVQGVLIKCLTDHVMLTDCLRVTVGKPEENKMFLEALKVVLNQLD